MKWRTFHKMCRWFTPKELKCLGSNKASFIQVPMWKSCKRGDNSRFRSYHVKIANRENQVSLGDLTVVLFFKRLDLTLDCHITS